ncbi:hypothetical protein L3X38_026939 [Prunus dulcis]|uniref:Uncharacterized protein n=1 Tax=Prunus dulcis TaxID=3755 RepID=A0AAD4VM42_PRUDU|nr:hypothetical protein L3X38_026939 [Prunus dulcis]
MFERDHPISVVDSATKGNRYINSCLRLNEEMKGIDSLALQLKILRRNLLSLSVSLLAPKRTVSFEHLR